MGVFNLNKTVPLNEITSRRQHKYLSNNLDTEKRFQSSPACLNKSAKRRCNYAKPQATTAFHKHIGHRALWFLFRCKEKRSGRGQLLCPQTSAHANQGKKEIFDAQRTLRMFLWLCLRYLLSMSHSCGLEGLDCGFCFPTDLHKEPTPEETRF